MDKNIKFLITITLSVVITGLCLLLFGSNLEARQAKGVPTSIHEVIIKESSSAAILGVKEEGILVTEVIDGDTFKLETGETVRMIGIDTPETVDPRRPVGCFGKESSNETKLLLTGKRVILQKDVTDKDKYDRILRLVYLPIGYGNLLFVNDYLVREGFAKVYTYPPDIKFDKKFKQAETQAKEGKKGMWEKCVKLE